VDNLDVCYSPELNKANMEAIEMEVRGNYTKYDIIEFKNFEEFFDSIEVDNAYEEGWEDSKDFYKPYYQSVYETMLKGK
jgi:hypothetical protein